jgi:hypothetical protein
MGFLVFSSRYSLQIRNGSCVFVAWKHILTAAAVAAARRGGGGVFWIYYACRGRVEMAVKDSIYIRMNLD